MTDYTRYAAQRVFTALESDPVVLIEGPRAVGKSTLLRGLAEQTSATFLDLDDLTTRKAVSRDPKFFASGPGPICIDEYQKVPELLDAIKAELNADSRPGRFVLAGSTSFDSMPKGTQALSGRLGRIMIEPLTQAEIAGQDLPNLSLLPDQKRRTNLNIGKTTREEYVSRILAGGYPLALDRGEVSRIRWVDDYLSLSLSRDIEEATGPKDSSKLKEAFRLLASQSGELVNISKLAQAANLNQITVNGYLQALKSIFLIEELPAWGVTLGSSVKRKSKFHIVDSLIAARMMRLTREKLLSKSPSALTEFGHLLESFVVGEIRRIASVSDQSLDQGHWRIDDEVEVDLILEATDGSVMAFEVKGSSAVSLKDARGILKLKEKLGKEFESGVIFYLGEHQFELAKDIWAIPVDALWA